MNIRLSELNAAKINTVILYKCDIFDNITNRYVTGRIVINILSETIIKSRVEWSYSGDFDQSKELSLTDLKSLGIKII